jgi:predicted permease
MAIPVLKGRGFLQSDNESEALSVAVVDQKLAERLFGTDDPIGKEILVDHFNETTFSLERLPIQVVGVVGNVRSTSLAAEGRETVYTSYRFNSFLPMTYVVRTAVEPTTLVEAIRGEVTAMDPNVPLSAVATLESYVSDSMAPTRFLLALIGVFAVVALVLASLGLYGVIAYSVRQRTREFGVRVAFGAEAGDVMRLVFRQGLAVSCAGVVVGLAVALGATRVMRSLLVGVSAWDAPTFLGVPALLVAVAAVATWVPARRATRVDPVEALRDE